MFAELENLTEVDFSNFKFSNISSMSNMFKNCINLEKVTFSITIDTSLVTNLEGMFYKCKSLKSLNLTAFDVSSVITMKKMFYFCTSLTSIDLSHFITNKVNNMGEMFQGCTSLKYVDISNFNATLVSSFEHLFSGCSNLKFINFNKMEVADSFNIINMFKDVPENIVYCINDENLNMINIIIKELNTTKLCSINDCTDNWYQNQKKIVSNKNTCVDDCTSGNTDCLILYDNKCLNECPNEKYLVIINDDKICLIECPESYPFIKNGECSEKCDLIDFLNKICYINNDYKNNVEIKDSIINEISNNIENGNDELNSLLSLNNNELTIIYPNEIYQITTSNNQYTNNYINGETTIILGRCESYLRNVYNLTENDLLIIYKIDYYMYDFLIPITEYQVFNSKNNLILNFNYCENINIKIPVSINESELYKYNPYSEYYNNSCYPSSLDCSNNNDITILNKRKKEFNTKNMSLCENNCTFINYYTTTKKVECQCKIKTTFSLLSNLYKSQTNLLYNFDINEENNENNSGNNDNSSINISKLNEVYNLFTNFFENINSMQENNNTLENLVSKYIREIGDNLKIEEENLNFQIISTELQDEYDNISFINLGECETRLRGKYNITSNYSLIIAKIDLYNTGYSIPKVEYDIYNPITKEKLDLDICNDTKIDILVPVILNEDELFLYNTSSDYYNDLCFPYTTTEGTDIILDDRKNEYINNNMSLCEDNCEYTGYNIETKKAICNCNVKMATALISEIKLNNEKILKNFINIKNKINLSTMKCFKLVFSKKGLIKNIGSYVMIVIISIDIAIAILFKIKGFVILSNKIEFIENILKSNTNINNNKNKINDKKKTDNINQLKDGNNNEDSNTNIPKEFKKSSKKKRRKKLKKKKTKKNININNPNRKGNNKIRKSNEMLLDVSKRKLKKIHSNKINNVIIFSKITKNEVQLKTISINYKYNEYELNGLDYEEAKKIDKRTYFQYYFGLLKRKQLLIFTFYTSTDYNSRILKISLFLFSFALYITINALFFNDDTMHKIYEDQGSFNFLYNLPKILYSTIISSIINFIIVFLSLTEKDIIKIKKKFDEKKEDLNSIIKNTEKCLKIKIIIFFVFNFLFILFFWYYLSSFCAVYQNTQKHLFKDVSMSFSLSLLYPFGLALLPGIFRIPELNHENENRKCLYNFSKIMQLI